MSWQAQSSPALTYARSSASQRRHVLCQIRAHNRFVSEAIEVLEHACGERGALAAAHAQQSASPRQVHTREVCAPRHATP